jgi:hypothetical protein
MSLLINVGDLGSPPASRFYDSQMAARSAIVSSCQLIRASCVPRGFLMRRVVGHHRHFTIITHRDHLVWTVGESPVPVGHASPGGRDKATNSGCARDGNSGGHNSEYGSALVVIDQCILAS